MKWTRAALTASVVTSVLVVATATPAGAGWRASDDNLLFDVDPARVCRDGVSLGLVADEPRSVSALVEQVDDLTGDVLTLATMPQTALIRTPREFTEDEEGQGPRGGLRYRLERDVTWYERPLLDAGTSVRVTFTSDQGEAEYGATVADCQVPRLDVVPGPTAKVKVNKAVTFAVGVLSRPTGGFDATTIVAGTARFGHHGTEARAVGSRLRDVDGDGTTDLVLTFRGRATRLDCGWRFGVLRATQADQSRVLAVGRLKAVCP